MRDRAGELRADSTTTESGGVGRGDHPDREDGVRPFKFPLPVGHVFGPSQYHVSHHDGRGKTDGLSLRRWQARFCSHWRRPWMHPNGLYDALTQRAVVEVQERAGLPRTGLLGPREWEALWTHTPEPPKPRKPPETTKLSRQELRKRRRYWEKFSEWQVQPGSDPDAPVWYPGRPFGPHHKGDCVIPVQEVCGFNPTGRFQVNMARRLAGLQRAHGLPESGVVDARTASLIESLRQK